MDVPENYQRVTVPTTADVWKKVGAGSLYDALESAALDAAEVARVFHWPLAFPDVLIGNGGFDAVLGNPPWDVVQLSEKEYFESRVPEIADLVGVRRKKAIAELQVTAPDLFADFEQARRSADSVGSFARSTGRFPLTSIGKLNTYGLFSELGRRLRRPDGWSGLIVPSEIVSSEAYSGIFADVIGSDELRSVIAFENEEFIFPGIANVNRFCLLTIGRTSKSQQPSFAFYLRNSTDIEDARRRFVLSSDEIQVLNPNSLSCPVFRTQSDMDLTLMLYRRVPVLLDHSKEKSNDSWRISFRQGLFNLTNDSGLFKEKMELENSGLINSNNIWADSDQIETWLPVYEGKFIWHYDHRFSSFHNLGKVKGRGGRGLPPTLQEEYENPDFEIEPNFWVKSQDVDRVLASIGESSTWLLGWRDVANAKVERTMVPAAFPRYGAGNTLTVLQCNHEPKMKVALLANLSAMPLDFIARQKISGSHLTQFGLEQFPILPPSAYSDDDLSFIASRVLELSYTSNSMAPFARDLGYDGEPFAWDEDRRAMLRAELDAWYALAYGLTRDELRYVLDPKDVMGEDYPSETFRVLQKNEIAKYGEYRTRRLVLAAYDAMISDGHRPRVEGYR